MAQTQYEYKSVKITSSSGCLVMQKLIDIGLNTEAENGWELASIFPHSCSQSNNCLVAVFKREKE